MASKLPNQSLSYESVRRPSDNHWWSKTCRRFRFCHRFYRTVHAYYKWHSTIRIFRGIDSVIYREMAHSMCELLTVLLIERTNSSVVRHWKSSTQYRGGAIVHRTQPVGLTLATAGIGSMQQPLNQPRLLLIGSINFTNPS